MSLVRLVVRRGVIGYNPLRVFAQKNLLFHGIRYYASDVEQKYRDKLLNNAKRLGFQSVEELKEHLKDTIDEKKRQLNKIDPLKELEEYEASQEGTMGKITKPQPAIDPNLKQAPYKTLDSFLNLNKVKTLSAEEIEFLWRAKWGSNENVMSAVVSNEIYDRMYKHIRTNPIFVLPLPRQLEPEVEVANDNSIKKDGMELHYIQWQFVGPTTVHCILTSLEEFKLHNQYARPHTTLEFFTDLSKDKNIVLMKGTIEPNSNIKPHDAQLLLLNIQRFYGALGEDTDIAKKRIKLLNGFTKGSPDFNVDTLIELAQSLEN
ncbi:similar to Saccharomyces cerevisiae YNL315C ATP11 Molecular chaperone, required for the assembly of alpha and beta subunits into the F1 sector of mitochondrial F1F0 ATP synthase [Maudiozyma barnettii]|uniref:Similar to Saccharomyces cerevisiae YNL315C ATP11 Molecular chaperone, required for the assembly of alpha and beta subunits into the F1 sector of mitochondrial F1F0 ATP synthase n=1 Tax=Maudiozyma barnettii TaxID=61262 RepID=A0A8H2VDK8_9SACH|nr:Atp11p [Kazachstania barnettii]CAB4253518.1 similar to Saccharomyces cerevisiae YNL315C ATP11 Molecular chaperone, required for the assembly of alpha and beta subunits into the F1 sector of mitochondrial F1F0 ATP synthase [Kazachstania barnettii]CAD1781192.1 similar to Saccharomyces cerevisiae YNL315C ATP11 Molecular chaperone, required for the assembly of alpha and beta subunits into the F1 sector of mitochondrial F1F0 ATP synthase [Kazachstania barnettii]